MAMSPKKAYWVPTFDVQESSNSKFHDNRLPSEGYPFGCGCAALCLCVPVVMNTLLEAFRCALIC
jgi:hypothetical protein